MRNYPAVSNKTTISDIYEKKCLQAAGNKNTLESSKKTKQYNRMNKEFIF